MKRTTRKKAVQNIKKKVKHAGMIPRHGKRMKTYCLRLPEEVGEFLREKAPVYKPQNSSKPSMGCVVIALLPETKEYKDWEANRA